MIHSFSLKILGFTEINDDIANRLHEAGCDDALLSSSEGTVRVDFDREARNRQEAIESAIANVRSVGFKTELIR